MTTEGEKTKDEGEKTTKSALRSTLQFFRPSSATVEPDVIPVGASWREILAASARTSSVRAAAHAAEAKTFLLLGCVVATVGLIVFIAMVTSAQWAASATVRFIADKTDQKVSLEQRFKEARDVADREEEEKFALIAMQKEGRKQISNPESLKEFEALTEKAIATIDRADDFRRRDMAERLARFETSVTVLKLITDSEEHFLWHRDLLPLARSVSVLLFIEVLAGFLLAHSRRQEALALHWARERRTCERLLAMPGILAAVNAEKIPVTDALVTALTKVEIVSPAMDDVNPTIETIRNVAGATAKGKPSPPG